MQIHVDFIRFTHHKHLHGQNSLCFGTESKSKFVQNKARSVFQTVGSFDIGIDRSGKISNHIARINEGSKSDTFGFHYQVGLAAKYGSDSQWIKGT